MRFHWPGAPMFLASPRPKLAACRFGSFNFQFQFLVQLPNLHWTSNGQSMHPTVGWAAAAPCSEKKSIARSQNRPPGCTIRNSAASALGTPTALTAVALCIYSILVSLLSAQMHGTKAGFDHLTGRSMHEQSASVIASLVC